MPMTSCPDCGQPISPGAVVCPHCGFPIRAAALPQGVGAWRPGTGGSSGNRTVVIVLIGAALLFIVVVIGIIAALAIPRFAQAGRRAREIEGETQLRWAYTAEQTYFARNGRYTTDLAQLGTRPPVFGPVLYTLQVSAAGDRDLCVEAVPAPKVDAGPLSMDANGILYHGAGCTGQPEMTEASPLDPDAGAMLEALNGRMRAYHREHGRYPTSEAEVKSLMPESAGPRRYSLAIRSADEYGVCVSAVPEAGAASEPYSMDQDGYIYAGPSCGGQTLKELNPDPSSSARANTTR